jgi:hypothetical protein
MLTRKLAEGSARSMVDGDGLNRRKTLAVTMKGNLMIPSIVCTPAQFLPPR